MRFNSTNDQRPDKINSILKLADDFHQKTKDELVYCLDNGQFYIYANGYWRGLAKKEDELWLFNHEEITYLNKSSRRDFIDLLGTITQVPLEKFNNKEILNLENGILDIKTMEFVKHHPDYLSTIRLPYNYDPNAKHPIWDAFLKTSLEGDKARIDVIQEFAGYSLGKDNSFHKSIIFIGEGRNGKGVTIEVFKNLVGNSNYSSVTLDKLNRPEVASNLLGKLINIDADMDSHAEKFEAAFRMVSAGDEITVKKLYKDYFQFRPYCKLIMSANDLPRISDKTRGFYDRLIIIPFNVSFAGREDFNLRGKLKEEISGIFNWALEGRRRLYERGRFSLNKRLEDYIEDVKKENNPVAVFIDEYVGFGNPSIATLKSDLYKLYERFCKETGHHPSSKIRFGREFFRLCENKTQKDARLSNTFDRSHIWPNIFIRGVNEPLELKIAEDLVWDK